MDTTTFTSYHMAKMPELYLMYTDTFEVVPSQWIAVVGSPEQKIAIFNGQIIAGIVPDLMKPLTDNQRTFAIRLFLTMWHERSTFMCNDDRTMRLNHKSGFIWLEVPDPDQQKWVMRHLVEFDSVESNYYFDGRAYWQARLKEHMAYCCKLASERAEAK